MNVTYEALSRLIADEIEKYLSEMDAEDVSRITAKIKQQLAAGKEVSKELGQKRKGFSAEEWLKFQNALNSSEKGKLYKQQS